MRLEISFTNVVYGELKDRTFTKKEGIVYQFNTEKVSRYETKGLLKRRIYKEDDLCNPVVTNSSLKVSQDPVPVLSRFKKRCPIVPDENEVKG